MFSSCPFTNIKQVLKHFEEKSGWKSKVDANKTHKHKQNTDVKQSSKTSESLIKVVSKVFVSS